MKLWIAEKFELAIKMGRIEGSTIPELWRELNQKMTLNWETSVILPSQVLP